MTTEIETLNKIIKDIVQNQSKIVTMIENKTLPWIPSIVPHMDYNDEIVFFATKFYTHILVTRHIHDMIEMWVNAEQYVESNYASQIEEKLSELISLCTGLTFLELTEKQLWKSMQDN